MLRRFLLILFLQIPGGSPGTEVSLKSGERIQGHLEVLRSESFTLRPRWSGGEVTVPLKALDQMLWPERELRLASAGEVEVLFRSGDRLSAEWLEMDNRILTLRTAWGQTVRVNRGAVAEIHPGHAIGPVRLQGPSPEQAWTFRDPRGAGLAPGSGSGPFSLYAMSGMSAQLELPELPKRFVFEADIRPGEQAFMYRMNLMGRRNNTRGPGNINLQVTHQGLILTAEGRERADAVTWRDRLPDTARTEQRFALWVDLQRETVEVDLNEERLLTLKLPGGSERIGDADRSFSIQMQSGDGEIELAGIRLRERLSTFAPNRPGSVRADRDQVYLLDGKRLTGRVISGGPEQLRVLEGRDVQTVPVHRVASVVFAAGPENEMPDSEERVRIRTLDFRGQLSLRPSNAEPGVLRGFVPGWLDEAVIPFSALLQIGGMSGGESIPSPKRDQVHLLNGDRVDGVILGMEGTRLMLEKESTGERVSIPAAYVGHIRRLGERMAIDRRSDVRLDYVNGDRLSGRLLGIGEASVELETSWGQRVRSRRNMIRRMEFIPSGPALIWRGPGLLSDWHVEEIGPLTGTVEQAGSALLIPGVRAVSRGMPPLPERFEIQLRMRSEGGRGDFTVQLFSIGSLDLPVGGLHFYSRGVRLEGVENAFGHGQSVHFRHHTGDLREAGRRDFRVIGDLRRGEMLVEFNGEWIGPWKITDPAAMRMQPERIMKITARSPFQRLWVEEILFAAYPYDFPVEREGDAGGGFGDRVLFANGDVLWTTVLDGEGDSVRLLAEGETLQVPRQRIQSIAFDAQTLSLPRRTSRDMRLHHAGTRDRLTVSLRNFDGSVFRGGGDLWLEDLHLPHSAFRVAVFNIHTKVRRDARIEGESE